MLTMKKSNVFEIKSRDESGAKAKWYFARTVKSLLEDALLFHSRILERASIQILQNFMK